MKLENIICYNDNSEEEEENDNLTEEVLNKLSVFPFFSPDMINQILNNNDDNKSSSSFVDDLSSLSCAFADDSSLMIKENRIIHNGRDRWETCLIGDVMSKGVYKIKIGKKNIKCSLGIVDGSFTNIRSGKSISELHAGAEMKFEVSDKVISFTALGSSVQQIFQNIYGDGVHQRKRKDDDSSVNLFNRSNKKVGVGIFIKDKPISVELDLRSSDPNKRCAYFSVGFFSIPTYFFGLPPTVRFAVCCYNYFYYYYIYH